VVLANIVRTDRHKHRRLPADDDTAVALKGDSHRLKNRDLGGVPAAATEEA
jgi:hypothetical protein